MRRQATGSWILLFLAASLFSTPPASAQVGDRIAQPIQTGEAVRLSGSVHPQARAENDRGQAPGSMMLYRMVMTFNRTATQQADLDALLEEQQSPLSPYYHQWLTPEQFADRFGLSSADIAKVVSWLQAQGFMTDEVARSRTYVAFSGTAAQVQASFGTSIHRYLVSGESHYANASDPILPLPLANVVTGIRGLTDFRPKPRGGITRPRPQFTSSISGNHFLAPDDFATIYNLKPLYSSGIDGTGQKLAVMGQSDLILSDIATFRSVSGLPANVPTVVLVPGSADPGVSSGDIDEANLDVQWSGAVARNAAIIYVNSTNAFNSMGYAIAQNLAPVLSISYGDCEPNFSQSEINTLVSWGQQANAQGQTIFSASGDSGATDCDYPLNSTTQVTSASHGLAVDVPAALPYVTGMGGTTFNEGSGTFWNTTNNANNGSAISYIPEVVWNDTAFEIANGGSIAATGGGVSTLFAKPSWQTGTGVPNDGKRDVPDISFNASFDHDGYLMCSQGSCVNGYRQANNNLTVVGGTSAGSPVFAGIMALINQKTGTSQGNANPRLYQLAGTSTDVFHDVITGDNKIPCTAGTKDCPTGTTSIGYTAGFGYDTVTGLGSVDAFHLVNEWSTAAPAPDFALALANSTMTLTAGSSSNVGTTTLTLTPSNGFTGTVSFTCSVPSTLAGTTCGVSPSSLATSGSVTVTVTAPTTRTVDLRPPRLFPHFMPWTDGTFAIAMGLMMAGKRERASKKSTLAVLALIVIIAVGVMIGCGGGGSSSTTQSSSSSSGTSVVGTGTVTVTATSGSLTHTATILVTVN